MSGIRQEVLIDKDGVFDSSSMCSGREEAGNYWVILLKDLNKGEFEESNDIKLDLTPDHCMCKWLPLCSISRNNF